MKKIFPCLTAGMLTAGLFPMSPAMAEEGLGSPVLVTATRTAQLADQVLAPVILISREDIERSQAVDVADLLRFHAGLDLGRNGGPGQATSLFLRGTNSDHTLVMIDGVRINPGTIGGAALHNLDPAMIERIEIVKGPRSSLYGSEAIGGVINIITRRATEGTEGNVAIGGGSFGTRKFSGGLRHGRDGTRFGLEASHSATDGYAPLIGSDIERGHDNTSLNAHVGKRFDLVDVELSHYEARGNTEYSDFTEPDLGLDQDFRNSATALAFEFQPVARWASQMKLSQSRDEIDQNQSPDFAHTDRRMADWQNDVQFGDHRLVTAGLWFMREDVEALSFGDGFDEKTDTRAIYVQDTVEIGAHNLLAAARYTDHESFGGHTTWDAGYGYRLSSATRLNMSAGTAFRAPNSSDRFGFGGDPDLRPEESLNFEVGLRHQLSTAQRLTLGLFHNDIEELIDVVCDANFVNCLAVNIGKARIRGIEAGYEFAAGGWRAALEASFQDPENRDTGNQLPRRAERSLTASLGYDAGHWQVGTDFLANSRRKDSDFNVTELAGYGLMNLTAAWHPAPAWTLRARVENLFDKDYTLAQPYRTAERSYFLQLAWRHDA